MELPNLGKQCAEGQCKQLDFLPFQCKCGKIFCLEHHNSHVQTCVQSKFLSQDELRKISNVFVCSNEGCKERSVVPLVCQRCMKHFCVRHRHLIECVEKSREEIEREKEKYAAPVRQFHEIKTAVDKDIEQTLAQAKKKEKSRKMAAKVLLMKIKNKATGQQSIPTSDRVYFSVTLPKSVSRDVRVVLVFVSKNWSLGRAIDAVAVECKLQNNNNKSHEKKLRLFRKDGGKIVSSDMSANLSSCIAEEVVVDGDELLIEYVDDNCTSL